MWIARQGVRGDGNDVVGEEAGMRRDGDDAARRSRGRGETRQRRYDVIFGRSGLSSGCLTVMRVTRACRATLKLTFHCFKP